MGKNLSFKLLSAVVSTYLIVAVLAGTLVYQFSYLTSKELLSNNQLGLAAHIMDTVNEHLLERQRDVEQISGEMFYEDELKGESEHEGKDDIQRMKQLTMLTGPWDLISAVDLEGKIFASTDSSLVESSIYHLPRSLAAFEAAKDGKVYHSDLVLSDDGSRLTMIYAAPIRDSEDSMHSVIGVLISDLTWSAIEEIISSAPLHEDAHAVLINSQGTIIAANRGPALTSFGPNIMGRPGIKEILSNSQGSTMLSENQGLIERDTLASYAQQKDREEYVSNGWGLLIETPGAVALERAYVDAKQLVCYLVPIFLAMGIVTYLVLSRYILRPISLLTNTAKAISNGEFSLQAPVLSTDEIGQLAEAFNQMIHTLNKTMVSKEYLETTLASIGDAVIVTDMNAGITFMNQSAQDLTGWSLVEVRQKKIGEVFAIINEVTSEQTANPVYRVLETGAICGLEKHTMLVKKNGEKIHIDDSAAPIRDQARQIIGVILVFRDVSEQYRAEKEKAQLEVQLRGAQKLESIGQLAAGIAHEINTPIQYVNHNTRFLETSFQTLLEISKKIKTLAHSLSGDDRTQEIFREIDRAYQEGDIDYIIEEVPTAISQSLEGIKRVSEIVKAMKEFSHPGHQEMTMVDLNKAIQTTITVSKNEWKYVAEIETDFDRTLPFVPCLPGEINQVFLNIIVNAAHAIQEKVNRVGKGVIKIQTRNASGWAEIRIKDTGSGIPENIRERIFDPFFTTKEVGKGTGQGLAIARAIVLNKHQGDLKFESESGQGTTFIIRLPLVQARSVASVQEISTNA